MPKFKKFLSCVALSVISLNAFADISWINPPASTKVEEVSTRGVDLCMSLNYVLALSSYGSLQKKHTIKPYLTANEFILEESFSDYFDAILNAGILSEYLSKATSDLVGSDINPSTMDEMQDYFIKSTAKDLVDKKEMCKQYVTLVTPIVDPDKKLNDNVDVRKLQVAEVVLQMLKDRP